MKLSPGRILLSLAVLALAGVFVRLGFWQLDRREQRAARNDAWRSALAAPPLALDSAGAAAVSADPAAYVNRRVTVRGVYDPAGQVVLRGRVNGGRPGVHVVTPLVLDGGAAVLVNRGWAPSPDGATVDPRPLAEPGPRVVSGVLQTVPRTGDAGQPVPARDGRPATWRRLDLDAARARSPRPLLPLYVQQLPAAGEAAPLARVDVPELSAGPHLSYAVQWFSFAAIAVVGLAILLLRRSSD